MGGSGVLRSRGSAGIAQEVAAAGEAEARRLHLAHDEGFLHAVQRAGLGDAGAGAARMVGDHVRAAGLQRANTARFTCARSTPMWPKSW
jgi:hypothetical protein